MTLRTARMNVSHDSRVNPLAMKRSLSPLGTWDDLRPTVCVLERQIYSLWLTLGAAHDSVMGEMQGKGMASREGEV